jgi:protein-L-isoaspartate(D-aspartate) O-methyltransferase
MPAKEAAGRYGPRVPRTQEGLARLVEREGLRDARIVEAFRTVARADFVPQGSERDAYSDRPVGIPENQTTSQPSLIARMIDAVAPKAPDRALEVGTGLGFQTALLSQLVAEVVSVERWESLARQARAALDRAGVPNVEIIVGDGWRGAPDHAPFDVVIVSAAATGVPRALVEQLAEGGRMVIPVRGDRGDDVLLFKKSGGELVQVRLVTPARFVPLVPGPPGLEEGRLGGTTD